MVQFGQVVTLVQERADIPTVLMADRATRSVLVVLSDRLAACGKRRVAYQLPSPLAAQLPEVGDAEEFGLDEFYDRIAYLEGTQPEVARLHARTVMGVLRDRLSGGTFEEIASELPQEYGDLLGAWSPR